MKRHLLYALLCVNALHGSDLSTSKQEFQEEPITALAEQELIPGMWGTPNFNSHMAPMQFPNSRIKVWPSTLNYVATPYWNSILNESPENKNVALRKAHDTNQNDYLNWRQNVINALECGADPAAVQQLLGNQCQLLGKPVDYDDCPLVEQLLKKGVRIAVNSNAGAPLLHRAPETAMARILIEHDAHTDPAQTKDLFGALVADDTVSEELITFYRNAAISPEPEYCKSSQLLNALFAATEHNAICRLKKFELLIQSLDAQNALHCMQLTNPSGESIFEHAILAPLAKRPSINALANLFVRIYSKIQPYAYLNEPVEPGAIGQARSMRRTSDLMRVYVHNLSEPDYVTWHTNLFTELDVPIDLNDFFKNMDHTIVLHRPVAINNLRTTECLLVKYNANLHKTNGHGSPPIHEARTMAMAQLLIKHGALNLPALERQQCVNAWLHRTMQKEYEPEVTLFLINELAADPFDPNENGDTPLMHLLRQVQEQGTPCNHHVINKISSIDSAMTKEEIKRLYYLPNANNNGRTIAHFMVELFNDNDENIWPIGRFLYTKLKWADKSLTTSNAPSDIP